MQAKTYIHLWDSKSVLFLQPTYKLDPSCGRWEHSHADYVLIFLLLHPPHIRYSSCSEQHVVFSFRLIKGI